MQFLTQDTVAEFVQNAASKNIVFPLPEKGMTHEARFDYGAIFWNLKVLILFRSEYEEDERDSL